MEPSKFFICEKYWPENTVMIKMLAGYTCPACEPSILNVPFSCLPTPKPVLRQAKPEDQQLN